MSYEELDQTPLTICFHLTYKQMKRLFLLIVIVFLLSPFHSCRKTQDIIPAQKLPEATQEGKHTLGFLFGDEIWLPFRTDGLSANFGKTSSLQLLCKRENALGSFPLDRFSLDLSLPNPGVGEFELNKSNTDILLYVIQKDKKIKGYRFHEKGMLKITRWDRANLIASAIFSFDLIEDGTGEIIKVSQGRFDLKLKY